MADDRELRLKVKVEDEASRPLHTIGDSADGAKAHLDGMNLGLKKLDGQIADTKKTISGLREEIARTGDLDLTKDLQKQEAALRAFERQRKSILGGDGKSLLGDLVGKKDGEKAADNFALGLAKKLPQAFNLADMASAGDGAGLAIGAPIVAGIVSYLGAVATGGVLATAAIGAVAVGVKVASQDQRVQSAAKDLSDSIGNELKGAAAPFVPATIHAIGIIKTAFGQLDGDLRGIFGGAAGYLAPLTRGVMGFVRELVPGFREAVTAAKPVVDMLERQLPEMGRAIGDVFSELSKHADEGAVALGYLFGILDLGIKFVGSSIGTLASVFKWMDLAGAALAGNYGHLAEYIHGNKDAATASNEFADALKGIKPPVDELNAAYRGQIDALDELANKEREQTDPMFALIQSQRDLTKAQNDYNTAVRKHGEYSPTAQDALRKMAEAALKVESATGKAAGMFDGKLTPAMHATLRAAGFTEGQIHDLEKQFGTAKTAGDKFAKTYQANVIVTYQGTKQDFIGPISPSAPWGHKAAGGPVVGPGPKGVDSVPTMLAPGEDVLTVADVDAAGGHGAIDQFRRMVRSGTWPSRAASSGAQGPTVIELRSSGSAMDDMLLELLRRAVRVRGGNVQVVLGGVS